VHHSDHFVAFSFFARAPRVPRCAAADITAYVLHRVLHTSRKAQAFPIVRAVAPRCQRGSQKSAPYAPTRAVLPCHSILVRLTKQYSPGLRFLSQVSVGVFALAGRSSGTRRNSHFESAREFVHHLSSARHCGAPLG
jgi:hypothetical protein